MRIKRRGSVTIEALMVLPIAIAFILLGRYILEASLNRQEAAVFSRGAAVNAGQAGSTNFVVCDFDRQDFQGRPAVAQTATVSCSRRNSEGGLSREAPVWNAAETGAAAWPKILRDVKPSRSPRDIVSSGDVTLRFVNMQFLQQQSPKASAGAHVAPDDTLWSHDEGRLAEGHDRVVWEELCAGRGATYALFPNVFPNARSPRC